MEAAGQAGSAQNVAAVFSEKGVAPVAPGMEPEPVYCGAAAQVPAAGSSAFGSGSRDSA